MNKCIICGREVRRKMGKESNITCSRDCSKKYARIYTRIKQNLQRGNKK